jgi:hypothetical protein
MSIIASRGTDQFALRFPDGLRDQIKADAEANGRSMNAEIVARLEGGAETLRDKFAGQALAGRVCMGNRSRTHSRPGAGRSVGLPLC